MIRPEVERRIPDEALPTLLCFAAGAWPRIVAHGFLRAKCETKHYSLHTDQFLLNNSYRIFPLDIVPFETRCPWQTCILRIDHSNRR
jgi:hypothetical protein